MAGRRSRAHTGAARTSAVLARAVLLLCVPLVVPGAAAAAAPCTGVTVVVDPPRVEPSVSCVSAPTGASAAEVFEESGRELTRVQRFPAAVCRVDGVPSGQPCVAMPPADAYWGFFVSEGGEWRYSDLGVDAVTPEAGQAIALTWQDTAERDVPAVAPAAVADTDEDAADGTARTQPDQGVTTPTLVAASLVVALGVAALLVARRRR